jgi:hypothetical protein
MTTYPAEISVVTPVNQALDRVKQMLFKPFDIGKWFVIGFCAWLAILGESGGGFRGNFGPGQHGPSGGQLHFRDFIDHATHWIAQNLYWLVPLAAVLLILAFALGLLLTWLSSRGKFMFLHCVALDRAEVKRPWSDFAAEANSLFWFRFVLGLIGLVLCLPLLAGVLLVIARMIYVERADQGGIIFAGILGLALVAIVICLALIKKFTFDFVVPIMFLRRTKCTTAWTEFRAILGDNIGRFTLYVLFQIVLAIAIGFVVLGVVIITCCLAGCVMAIPYLGTVLLLPVLVFKRSYSIYYLAQYGPAYSVFPPGPPTLPA